MQFLLHALEKELKPLQHRLRKQRAKLEQEEKRIAPLKADVKSCESRIENLNCRIRIWHEARVRTVKEVLELTKSKP